MFWSFPKYLPPQPELHHAKAMSQELSPGLPGEQQGPSILLSSAVSQR